MSWQILTDEQARDCWNADLIEFSDCSPFQTLAFGEYNRALGWRPIYLKNCDETGAARALMLGLLRRYPLGVGLFWCPGGPVGDIRLWNDELQQAIAAAANIKRLYCRFRCDRERDINDVLALNHQKWTRSWFIMHSGFTMELDLSRNDAEFLRNCSRNWRRNLHAAERNNLRISVWQNPNAAEIADVYAEMQRIKKMPEQFSVDELKNIVERAGNDLIVLRGEDESGALVAVRGCLIAGSRACDYLAATTERGRELRGSHKVFFELMKECRRRGVRFYDLGGIDPQENPGVYDFKRGTGARAVECLGEWNRATSELMLWLGNFAMQKRHLLAKLKFGAKRKSARPATVENEKRPNLLEHGESAA